jgi:hypothetical protein
MTYKEFEARCAGTVDRLAQHFAHESDDAVAPQIDRLRRNLTDAYTREFPDATPVGIADLVDCVIGGFRSRRAEIAAAGTAA